MANKNVTANENVPVNNLTEKPKEIEVVGRVYRGEEKTKVSGHDIMRDVSVIEISNPFDEFDTSKIFLAIKFDFRTYRKQKGDFEYKALKHLKTIDGADFNIKVIISLREFINKYAKKGESPIASTPQIDIFAPWDDTRYLGVIKNPDDIAKFADIVKENMTPTPRKTA